MCAQASVSFGLARLIVTGAENREVGTVSTVICALPGNVDQVIAKTVDNLNGGALNLR